VCKAREFASLVRDCEASAVPAPAAAKAAAEGETYQREWGQPAHTSIRQRDWKTLGKGLGDGRIEDPVTSAAPKVKPRNQNACASWLGLPEVRLLAIHLPPVAVPISEDRAYHSIVSIGINSVRPQQQVIRHVVTGIAVRVIRSPA
jgi:hypothetical protein